MAGYWTMGQFQDYVIEGHARLANLAQDECDLRSYFHYSVGSLNHIMHSVPGGGKSCKCGPMTMTGDSEYNGGYLPCGLSCSHVQGYATAQGGYGFVSPQPAIRSEVLLDAEQLCRCSPAARTAVGGRLPVARSDKNMFYS